ncbi:MAG: hypothetical protein GX612_02130 [Bacteroidales bacterium]|nr:hypothetical protein [Bacteroidales bacterium]
MKTKSPNLPLRKFCFIEIYREGKYSGKGIFMMHAGKNDLGEKLSRIINERDMIDFIPTKNIKRIGE